MVVFATETFAPTNVDEVKAADMFVIIKLFLYGVFMEDSAKLKKAGSTELSTTEERFSSKGDRLKKLQKKQGKKNKIFIRRDRRAFDCKRTTVCSPHRPHFY